MEAISLGFMALFVAAGLLIVGVSIPLMRRQVKPNRWYGFRTPKTMSSDRIWYEANAYAGRVSLQGGIIFIAAAIVLYFVLGTNFVVYNISCAVVMTGSILVEVLLSFRHLRSL